MAAGAEPGVGHDLRETRVAGLADGGGRRRVLALEEVDVEVPVRRRPEQHALRGQAVATRPTRLLVVALEAAGQVVVDDLPHVREVDAHPERGGRHHEAQAPVGERVLHPAPLLVGESRVVGGSGHTAAADQLGELD